MRTTVDIDLEMLDEAVRQIGAKSRGAAIDAGVRLLLQQAAALRLANAFGAAPRARAAPRRRP